MTDTKRLFFAAGLAGSLFIFGISLVGVWIAAERRQAAEWRAVAEQQQKNAAASAQQMIAQNQALYDLREETIRQRARMDAIAAELRAAIAKQELRQAPPTAQQVDPKELINLPGGIALTETTRPRVPITRWTRRVRDTGLAVAEPTAIPLQLGFRQLVAGRSWAPEQATGEPNTPAAGDQGTAWASRTQDGQPEWLELEYDQAVTITKVKVYETYNPGALVKVTIFDDAGKEHDGWEGKDPTAVNAPTGMGVSEVSLATPRKSQKIKIYLDSVNIPGWNEIDAVGIVDDAGKTHWAARAKTSSTFAEQIIEATPQPPINTQRGGVQIEVEQF